MSDSRPGVPGGWLPRLTLGFALFLLLLIVIANTGWFRSELLRFVSAVPGGDKSLHFVLVGTMALLLNLSWGAACWRLGPLPIQQGSVTVALLCTLEELSQLFVRARAFDTEDLLSDYFGIILLGQLGVWLHALLTRRVEPESGRGA